MAYEDSAETGCALWDVSALAKAVSGVSGSAEQRDPLTAQFINSTNLPMAAMVMGLLDSSDDCIKLVDGDGRLKMMNCNGLAALEIDDFATVEGQQWASLWPEESQPQIQQALAEARAGNRARFEAFCPTAKGTPRWWEVTVVPLPGQDGLAETVLATSRDVTERLIRNEQLETLALEMRHRLRNAFTVSAGIIGALGRANPDHGAFAKDAASRLTQLATVHAALLDHGGQMRLDELLRQVLLIEKSNQFMQLGNVPDLAVNEIMAKTLALVVGELATNSIKYGALGNGGKIHISGTIVERQLVLTWDESDGQGESANTPVSSGQGGRLTERMLASIGGRIESEERPDGFFARVTLPIPPEAT